MSVLARSISVRAARHADNGRARWATPALALVLAAAGIIHGALTPGHFAESAIMGLGFLGATVTQLALAGIVFLRPPRELYAAIVAMSLVLIALYAFNVAVGLPFHASAEDAGHAAAAQESHHGGESQASHHEDESQASHHAQGLVLGSGEPVDLAGGVTQGAQLGAIGLSVLLFRETRLSARRLPFAFRVPGRAA